MKIIKTAVIDTASKFDVDQQIANVKHYITIATRILAILLITQVVCINAGVVTVEFKGFSLGGIISHSNDFDRALNEYTPNAKKMLLDSAYSVNFPGVLSKTGGAAKPVEEEFISLHGEPDDYSYTKVKLTKKIQYDYIEEIAPMAQEMARETDIPASIKIAQALVESRYGTSKLAIENNAHFGKKCFSKKCKKGHCTNATDDHHKDFFRKYATVEDSFKSHSDNLKEPRYKRLFKISRTKNGKPDYKEWARGLQACGYATNPKYASILISRIEQFNLTKYDDKFLN